MNLLFRRKSGEAGLPLVAHLIHSAGCGGLQTVLTECIKRLPEDKYRHAVFVLTGKAEGGAITAQASTILYELNKPPGNDMSTHLRMWTLLRRLRPSILHTYNVGTIEYSVTAMLAGVAVRIHAEHGRDSVEINGEHSRYNLLRRLLAPIIDAYVPVSHDLAEWLQGTIGIRRSRITMVDNGVDLVRYAPPQTPRRSGPIWIGTVGRVDPIKNHASLIESFQLLLERFPATQFDLRLAIIGDGPLLGQLRELVVARGLGERVWMPGARTDVAELLQGFSLFVLPSLSEATPMVILEAMASQLPVVATRVGGVPQLVLEHKTGLLVEPADPAAFTEAMASYIRDPGMRQRHGAAGRAHVEARYSIGAMAAAYDALYTTHLARKTSPFPNFLLRQLLQHTNHVPPR